MCYIIQLYKSFNAHFIRCAKFLILINWRKKYE